MKLGSSMLKCPLCLKTVYQNEGLNLGRNILIHPRCFKCQKEGCSTKLSLLSFTGVGDKFFCAKHAQEEERKMFANINIGKESSKKQPVVPKVVNLGPPRNKKEELEQMGLGLGKRVTLSLLQGNQEVSSVDGRIRHLPISKDQFFEICEKYSKTYLTLEDAKSFLQELSKISCLDYDDAEADALIERCDENHDGWITLKEFHHLFFASTKVLQINLTKSLRSLQKKTLAEHVESPAPVKSILPKVIPTPQSPPTPTPTPPPTTGPLKPPRLLGSRSRSPSPSSGPPRKKWVVEEEPDLSEWKFNGKLAQYMPIDNGIDWPCCKGFNRSSAGSGGVFFLGWEGEKVAVLKGSSTVLADKVATEIGLWSKLPMPHLHIIKFGIGEEFLDVVKCLDRLDKLKPTPEREKHKPMTQIPILTVMEFVPGEDFTDVDLNEVLSTQSCDEQELQKRLFDIGRIIMYDVLLNNWDRLPILWASEGNLGNLFYSRDPAQRVIAIDNTITSIPLGTEPFQAYLTKVQTLLDEIVTFDGTEGTKPLVEKTRTYFQGHCGVDIGHQGTLSVWQGMLAGTITIVENVTKEKLEKLRDEMGREVQQVFDAMTHGKDTSGQYGLTRVKVEFIEAILTAFTEFVPRMKPLLS